MSLDTQKHNEPYIIIDCPPGPCRPPNILESILSSVPSLTISDFETVSKLFGAWTFELKDENKYDEYYKNISVIKEKLVIFYNSGRIRYAEWN